MQAGRVGSALAAALVSGAVVLAGAGVGSATTTQPQAGNGPAISAPGSVLWNSVHSGGGRDVVAAPQGGKVFIAGSTFLVAVDSATGAQLWSNSKGAGQSIAVSPDGKIVFVIKPVAGTGGANFWTAAFDASTGRQLWVQQYNGNASGADRPTALAVSPDNGTVFVTGTSPGKSSGKDFATVAYAVASGKRLWVSRFNAHGRSSDFPTGIAVSPNGGSVFVTGFTFGGTIGEVFSTVAYSAATGKSSWSRSYGQPNRQNAATALAVSPDGHHVIVTGESHVKGAAGDSIATIAYSASTGSQTWLRRYHGAHDRADLPAVVLTSKRDGGSVFVAGSSTGSAADYLVVVYHAATGANKWVRSFPEEGFETEGLGGAVLSATGRVLYLAGSAFVVPGGEEPAHSLTVAVNAHQGTQLWSKTVDTTFPDQVAGWISPSPGGSAVYIGVADQVDGGAKEFTTFALSAGALPGQNS